MAMEIYYLSGTGNSLHAARELQKKCTDSRLIPFAGLRNKDEIKSAADTVGFVFPVHFMTAPGIVFRTLGKMDLQAAEYIFLIGTRYGTPCRVMYGQLEKILKKKGKDLDAAITVNMASNDPKFKNWEPCSAETIDGFEAVLQKKLDTLAGAIRERKKYREEDREITYPVNPLFERLGVLAVSLTGDGSEEFYADSRCRGCGTCCKVCLSSKIRMRDGKPEWQKKHDCYSCYACLNFCPEKAVQLKSSRLFKFYTEQNGRYHHPEVSPEEIALQKLELTDGKVKG
jgi:ferredoxin